MILFNNKNNLEMKNKMPTFAGKKFSGSHTTVIKPAEKLIKALAGNDQVNKIVISMIKNHGSKGGQGGPARIKITSINAGMKLTVKGSATVQEFYVYTNDMKGVQEFIIEKWQTKGKKKK